MHRREFLQPEKWGFIAHLRAELGVGEASRRLLSLLRASTVQTIPLDFEFTKSRRDFQFEGISELPVRKIKNLISDVNPDQ